MNRNIVLVWLACLLLMAPVGKAGSPGVKELMESSTFRKAGLDKLSAEEISVLNEWLAGFTVTVFEYAKKQSGTNPSAPPTDIYSSPGSGHWVRSNSDGGRIITLEDGSTWEISSIDRIYTMLWLPLTNITVTESDHPVGKYRYLLLNTDDGETAQAKLLAR